MKKIITIFTTIILCTFAFAEGYKPVLHSKGTIRQQGFGGLYTTDKNSFEGMYANPAMLGERKKHSLFPSIQVNAAGELETGWNLIKKMKDGIQPQDIMNELSGKDRIVLKADVLPILSFGHISPVGFGWGLNTQVYADAIIPSVNKSNINVGAETVLTLGFGFKIINAEYFGLSVGATAKGFVQANAGYNGNPLEIQDYFKDIQNVPIDLTYGFGFDAGALVTIAKFLDIGVAYYDIYTPTYTTSLKLADKSVTGKSEGKIPGRLAAGVGFNIPVDGKFLSNCKIMVDYRDVFALFGQGQSARNPILELSAGIELSLFKILNFRFGISEMYPAAGFGLSFGTFKIEGSFYGRELGLEPGSAPCLNAGLNIGFNY